MAKRRSALTRLQAQFRARETGQTYLALVAGDWPARKKLIDAPLHKYLLDDGERRVKVVARDDPDGMRAVTLVKVAQRVAGFSLLEVTMKTGRTHQIRVQPCAAAPGLEAHVPARLAATVQSSGQRRTHRADLAAARRTPVLS